MFQTRYTLILVLSSILVSLPKIATAQYFQPHPVDMCGYHESRCFRDQYGNIVDKQTGNVYDRRGNLIQRGNGNSNTSRPRCRYVEIGRCGLYNINCTPNYQWVCNE
jgi:arginyl-tRNA--protein-N-Asp/Glu arginylyltransferase